MKAIRHAVRSLRLVLILSLLAAVAFGWIVTLDQSIEVDGSVLIPSLQRVRAEAVGSITAVRALPDSQVKAGDVLIEIADLERERERGVAEVAVKRARSSVAEGQERRNHLLNLQALEIGQQRSRLSSGRARIERLGARVQELRLTEAGAGERFAASQELEAAGLISKEAVRQAELAVGEARLRVQQAELQVAEETANAEAEQRALGMLRRQHGQALADIEAYIAEAQGQLREAELHLDMVSVLGQRELLRADIDGLFIAPPVAELVGRRVQTGETLATVVDQSSVVFRGWLDEQALVWIEPGQKVSLELYGFPKGEFGYFVGNTQSVARTPEPSTVTDASSRYRVDVQLEKSYVELEEGRFELREGMRGRAKIVYSPNTSLLKALSNFFVGRSRSS